MAQKASPVAPVSRITAAQATWTHDGNAFTSATQAGAPMTAVSINEKVLRDMLIPFSDLASHQARAW